MKGLFVVLFCVGFCIIGYSQTYNYGAIFAGVIVKSEGQIIISESDSLVTLSSVNEGVEKKDTYKFVKKVNRTIYFTDDVKTHNIIINKENGKKKGFDYNTAIILTFEGQTSSITYYCKEEN